MAQWIWNQNACDVNSYVDFICECNVERVAADAAIKVSVDGEYTLWINGEFVDCAPFDDFPEKKVYDELSVAEFLQPGYNRICFTVYHQGEWSYQYAVGEPGLWFELRNGTQIIESSEEVLSAVNEAYQQGSMYKTTRQLGFGFGYDARKEDDWLEAWKPATEDPFDMPTIPYRFEISTVREGIEPIARPIKKCVFGQVQKPNIVTQGVFLRPKSRGDISEDMQRDFLGYRDFAEIFAPAEEVLQVCSKENIYFVIDLGKETSGYYTFDVEAEEGTIIDCAYGEHLDDLRVRSHIDYRHFGNRYVCKEGRQQFTYYARRIAGRFLQFHITGKLRKIYQAGVIPSNYPVQDYLQFHSEDGLKNKIFQVSVDTLKLCMHEHYEDCPWREQGLYGSDGRNQMLSGYYAFREFPFARASLDLLGQSMGEGTWVRICAPTDDDLFIPSFSFVWVLAMKEYAEYSGDFSLAESYMDKFKQMYAWCVEHMTDGIAQPPQGKCYWSFYEWAEGNHGPGVGAIHVDADGLYQVFLCVALRSMEWLSNMLGDHGFAAQLAETYAEIKYATNNLFWNAEKGVYANYFDKGELTNYTELMQFMAVFSGVAGERTEALCDILSSENDLVKTTLSYAVYKYDVLLQQGDKYRTFVFEEMNQRWGNMLFQGATSFWETDKGPSDFGRAGSMCHGWSATPVYVYGRYLCGIEPEELRTNSKVR